MAGDWIQKRNDLHEDPAVIAITDATSCVDEDHTVGKLCRLWSWVSEQSRNGHALSVTASFLNRFIGVTGFCEAMIDVGWMTSEDGQLSIPNFERYMGQTAKKRAQDAIRSRDYRAKEAAKKRHAKPSRSVRDAGAVEERRGEKSKRKDSTNVESCGIPAAKASETPPPSPVFLDFPITGKSRLKVWNLTEAKLAEYQTSFPGLDVEAEMRAARQWCVDNPPKRKTHNGMPAFLTGWLTRSQNSGRGSGQAKQQPATRLPDFKLPGEK